jgi:hypothetical protein
MFGRQWTLAMAIPGGLLLLPCMQVNSVFRFLLFATSLTCHGDFSDSVMVLLLL